jgi:hypothetical protein
MIIEGSEDKYSPGTPQYDAWLEGRAHYMEIGEVSDDDNPYVHQPHTQSLAQAFRDGMKDEAIWALDSTGR